MHTLSGLVYDVVRVLAKSNSMVVIHLLAMVKKRVNTQVMLYQQHQNDRSETSVDAMEDGMIDDKMDITAMDNAVGQIALVMMMSLRIIVGQMII